MFGNNSSSASASAGTDCNTIIVGISIDVSNLVGLKAKINRLNIEKNLEELKKIFSALGVEINNSKNDVNERDLFIRLIGLSALTENFIEQILKEQNEGDDDFNIINNELADVLSDSLPLIVNITEMKVFFKNQAEPEITVRDEAYDEFRAYAETLQMASQDLLQNDTIDEDKLKSLVMETFDGTLPVEYTSRASTIANLASIKISRIKNASEMFLQQVVYSSIAEMFCEFSILDQYCADQKISCAHSVFTRVDKNADEKVNVWCSPDAALKLTDQVYLIAMMELKVKGSGEKFRNDLYRLILMTTMSIMAIGKRWENSNQEEKLDIAIPFIQGYDKKATLYVTRLNGINTCPTIHKVAEASFLGEDNREKVHFLAKLAVLLSRIVQYKIVHSEMLNDEFLKSICVKNQVFNSKAGRGNALPSEATRNNNNTQDSTENTQGGTGSTQGGTGSTQGGTGSTQGGTGTKDASENETAAKLAASQSGMVTDLIHPFPRIHNLNLDLLDDKNAMYKEELKFYRQESPFYFKGVTKQDGAVFCKVWREGDQHTDREDIKKEIQLFKRANANGIPSPKVVDSLTVLDLECKTSLYRNNSKPSMYHILVTQYHKDDDVAECDIFAFALSLVNAVQKLHSIGILHCDIKPTNVLWDATKKKLVIIDFGHAQEELNARWYTSTRMFEAPEISQKMPHNTMSDTFSVGKTLEYVIADFTKEVIGDIAVLVELLTNESDSNRMSLTDGEKLLRRGNSSNNFHLDDDPIPTNSTGDCCLSNKKRSIGEANDTATNGSPTSVTQ